MRAILFIASSCKIDKESGKPEIILFYNKTKGGTDSFDQKCHQYSTARKSLRWPLRMLYGMLDQANVNSFILYNLNEKNVAMKRMEFIFELSLQLVKPLLVRRLATPTLRVGLRHSIEEFLNAGDVPEDLNISLEFANNICEHSTEKHFINACVATSPCAENMKLRCTANASDKLSFFFL